MCIRDRLNMEENNQSDIPLGFNHKTRLEMQNGINQVPSQLLPQQVKYLEQMQQREVLDSQVSPSMNIKYSLLLTTFSDYLRLRNLVNCY